MSANRLRAHFETSASTPVTNAGMSCGFVPCPIAILSCFPMTQQLFVQEVYRIARERTETQLRPRLRIPEFSLN